MEARKHLIHWLRDAHGMEQQAESLLQRQSERLESYPEMKARIDRHIEETRSQAQRLEECLAKMGEDTSAIKDLGGKITANMGALMNAASDDEVVKNAIGSYSFEHFEIASYRSLIAAAEVAGEEYIAEVCRNILKEEEAMAQWVEQNLPTVTETFLGFETAGISGKR